MRFLGAGRGKFYCCIIINFFILDLEKKDHYIYDLFKTLQFYKNTLFVHVNLKIMAGLVDPADLENLRTKCVDQKDLKVKEEQNLVQFSRECDTITIIITNERERLYKEREKLRELAQKREDLKDKQKRELGIRQEKFRHLLYETHRKEVDSQIYAEKKVKEVESEQTIKERGLDKDVRALLAHQKEQTQKHFELLFNLRLQQDGAISQLREKYMNKTQYLRKIYSEKLRHLRQNMEEKNQ